MPFVAGGNVFPVGRLKEFYLPHVSWEHKKARLSHAIVEESYSIYFSHELGAPVGEISQQSMKEGHLGAYEG